MGKVPYKPVPPVHSRFKKGQSGNPLGGRAHSPATKALRKLTIDTYREVIELVLTSNLSALKALVENPKTSAVQVGVATAFLKAIKNGDYAVIERIAERIVGKIPDELNVRSKSDTTLNISKEALRAALKEIEKEL